MNEFIRRLLSRRISYRPEAVTAKTTPDSRAEAKQAITRADNAIVEATKRGPEVKTVVGQVKYQTDTNHFGEMIDKSMRPATN